jgi:DnaK suppressor protein
VRLIKYLDAALERIKRHTYGRCLSCGALIDRERLLAVPHTQLCIRCKQGNQSMA